MYEFPNAKTQSLTARAVIGSIAMVLTATSILSVTGTPAAAQTAPDSPRKVMRVNFKPRNVAQVEIGDFHFAPGQQAPIHTHDAPAVGYVAKGEIIYQVEGEDVIILREGDAFYEPTGQRILRFDNASATREAIFIDFNLEQAGEPFIVFEKAPTEAIDRRSLPTIDLDGTAVDQVEIFKSELAAGQSQVFTNRADATLGLVSEGVIELRIQGKSPQRIVAGGTFSLPAAGATIANTSSEVKARILTFQLD